MLDYILIEGTKTAFEGKLRTKVEEGYAPIGQHTATYKESTREIIFSVIMCKTIQRSLHGRTPPPTVEYNR